VEPLLPRWVGSQEVRPGSEPIQEKSGSDPIFLRVTLPFLAGYFVSYLYRSVNAIIGPEIARELGLSAAGLGLLSGIYFFAFALFQLPLGVLLDRYGPRRVNATLLLMAAAGGAWFALGQSAAELTAARALIGLGVSGCLMSAFSAFALWYPPERIAGMSGAAFATGMLGAIAASVPLEMALRVLHWREVFALIVALTLVVSLVLYLVVPERASSRRMGPLSVQLREFAALDDAPRAQALQVVGLLRAPGGRHHRVAQAAEQGHREDGGQRRCQPAHRRRQDRNCHFGFEVVATGFRARCGEIDIVARRRGTLVFVEVKARKSLDDAAEALTPRGNSVALQLPVRPT